MEIDFVNNKILISVDNEKMKAYTKHHDYGKKKR